MPVYKFRNCLLNTAERSVVKDRQHIELTTKTFDILQFLVENVGKVISKDEILGAVWNGSFVEESNLPVHISKLRRTLGQRPDCRFIETVQGVGYRFVAPVSGADEVEWTQATNVSVGSTLRPMNGLLALPSIAVLPFDNETQGPDYDYLSDGITESIINDLSMSSAMRVIARNTVFRYKRPRADAVMAGKELGVDKVLTGRVRIVGDRLLICVELTDPTEGIQVWGQHFDRPFGDLVGIEQEIVRMITLTITNRVITTAAETTASIGPEEYRLFLLGRYFMAKRTVRDVRKAVDYFRKALTISPQYVETLVAMAEAYYFLYVLDVVSRDEAFERIQPILQELSPSDTSVYTVQLMLGKLKFFLLWQFNEAEVHFLKALALNPSSVDCHFFYAEIMLVQGRFDEVRKLAHQLIFLDPASTLSFKRVGRLLYYLGMFDEALTYLEQAQEMEPRDYEALLLKGAVLLERGDLDPALKSLQQSMRYCRNMDAIAMTGCVEALRKNIPESQRIIEQLQHEAHTHTGIPIKIARIYCALGDFEKACENLVGAFDEHELDLYALGFDPRLKTLVEDPQFVCLIDQVMSYSTKAPHRKSELRVIRELSRLKV